MATKKSSKKSKKEFSEIEVNSLEVTRAREYEDMLYNKSKAKLNSIYGCMAQDQCKEDVIFNGIDFELAETPIADLLEKTPGVHISAMHKG